MSADRGQHVLITYTNNGNVTDMVERHVSDNSKTLQQISVLSQV